VKNFLSAYKEFAYESSLLGYSNNIKDKIEFLKMYLNGDYKYLQQ
jgi:hypothetical protein